MTDPQPTADSASAPPAAAGDAGVAANAPAATSASTAVLDAEGAKTQAPSADAKGAESPPRRAQSFTALRQAPALWQTALLGVLSVATVFGIWWFVTAGETTKRIYPHHVLPSPAETFGEFDTLWFDRALTRNLVATLRRVALGFGLAVVVGIPLGVVCGCFGWARAFFAPLLLFGRNIPVAALIPLTFTLFGIGEFQKVMFIFVACAPFVISDTADAVAAVSGAYVDTAYTLGARRWQIILKVLVPLALPSVFNSLRVLFGLAFGYIMLAELVKFGSESGGLGDIINISQRRGPKEHIFLVLLIIPIVAFAIDRLLFWIQRELFPHQYGGAGILNQLVRGIMHAAESVKFLLWHMVGIRPAQAPTGGASTASHATAESKGRPS